MSHKLKKVLLRTYTKAIRSFGATQPMPEDSDLLKEGKHTVVLMILAELLQMSG